MESEILEAIEVELKYCERCGGLWLRRRGTAEVYCRNCKPKMSEFPESRARRMRLAPPSDGEIQGFFEGSVMLCEEGQA